MLRICILILYLCQNIFAQTWDKQLFELKQAVATHTSDIYISQKVDSLCQKNPYSFSYLIDTLLYSCLTEYLESSSWNEVLELVGPYKYALTQAGDYLSERSIIENQYALEIYQAIALMYLGKTEQAKAIFDFLIANIKTRIYDSTALESKRKFLLLFWNGKSLIMAGKITEAIASYSNGFTYLKDDYCSLLPEGRIAKMNALIAEVFLTKHDTSTALHYYHTALSLIFPFEFGDENERAFNMTHLSLAEIYLGQQAYEKAHYHLSKLTHKLASDQMLRMRKTFCQIRLWIQQEKLSLANRCLDSLYVQLFSDGRNKQTAFIQYCEARILLLFAKRDFKRCNQYAHLAFTALLKSDNILAENAIPKLELIEDKVNFLNILRQTLWLALQEYQGSHSSNLKSHLQQICETAFLRLNQLQLNTNKQAQNELITATLPLINTMIESYYITEHPIQKQRIFSLIELSKAIQLVQKSEEDLMLFHSNIPKLRYDSLRNLNAQIIQTQSEIDNAINNKMPVEELVLIRATLNGLLESKSKLYATIDTTIAVQGFFKQPDLYVHQYALQSDEVFLHFHTLENSIIAQLVNRDTVVLHWSEDLIQIQNYITKLLATIKLKDDSYQESAKALANTFIVPITPFLRPNMIIVPSGQLAYLPFEILITQTGQSQQFLVEQYVISYAYSVQWMQHQENKRISNTSSTFLGIAPKFDSMFLVDKTAQHIVTRYVLDALNFNVHEIEQAGKIFHATLLKNEFANKNRVEELLPKFGIIHLATHSISDSKHGSKSELYLSKTNSNGQYETLTAAEISSMVIPADLVVLSSCESGSGSLEAIEGINGLARAFAFAGSKSIISAFWNVQDQIIGRISILFYTNLQKGLSKSEALTKAKRDWMSLNPEYQHPFYWASTILTGETGSLNPVYFKNKTQYWYQLIWTICLIFSFLVFLKRI